MPKLGVTIFYHPGILKPWTGDTLDYRWEKAREAIGSGLRVHNLWDAFGIKSAEEGCPSTISAKSWDITVSISRGSIMRGFRLNQPAARHL